MRAVLGVLSLLVVLAVIGVLAKKQMGALLGAGAVPASSPGVSSSTTNLQQQSHQLQNQVKKSVEDALQQARPMPDDK